MWFLSINSPFIFFRVLYKVLYPYVSLFCYSNWHYSIIWCFLVLQLSLLFSTSSFLQFISFSWVFTSSTCVFLFFCLLFSFFICSYCCFFAGNMFSFYTWKLIKIFFLTAILYTIFTKTHSYTYTLTHTTHMYILVCKDILTPLTSVQMTFPNEFSCKKFLFKSIHFLSW